MPVNMDPKNKRIRKPAPTEAAAEPAVAQPDTPSPTQAGPQPPAKELGQDTERDKELALADAEWKNLWDATEVIDMDRW